ncbi:hypothetical protein KIW84_034595 [Lathyrus oleraceus]|uniref:Uncharacterized protein n=1 Tax=Pisum sativum TaxID=3888 RepID=A0A9D4XYZ9_PEA|nr:hypothetical protein KIW84_034595 [Pisum sativum]
MRVLMTSVHEVNYYDEVLAALVETMKKGTSFGAPCLLENTLAEMVIAAVASIEMAGSGVATLGLPDSPGALTALFNDFAAVEKIFEDNSCFS